MQCCKHLLLRVLGYIYPAYLLETDKFNLASNPSLNTKSCIKWLLMVRDFCFWVVWQTSPVLKKKLGADYEQFLRAVFSCFKFFLKNL